MKTVSVIQSGIVGAALAASFCLSGCGAAGPDQEDIGQQGSALTITNCTGAAISAAIAAGGSVTLSCGASPITISVPSTTVAHPTFLSSTGAGKVTFTHVQTLFTVTSGASFTVSNINFQGSQTGGFAPAFVADGQSAGNITINLAQFSGYKNTFTILVGGLGSSLTLNLATFSGTQSTSFGPFIYNEGAAVNILDSSFSNNFVNGNGAAITSVAGSLTVNRSTFFNNHALGGGGSLGGAILNSSNSGACNITNSTFFANFANDAGGAVAALGAGGTTIGYSTFSNNSSAQGTISGSATVNASIIVDTVAKSFACNLAGSSNLQWPAVTPLCGPGFRFADPKLGAFGNNGGPTQTFSLTAGSAAIDSSSLACPPPTTDQRSVTRPRDGDGNGSSICDIGSFEL
jgi:hypothetical protein